MDAETPPYAYTGNGNLDMDMDAAIAAGKLAATEREAIAGVLADAGKNLPDYYKKHNQAARLKLYSRLAGTGWEKQNTRIWHLNLEL